MSYWEVIAQAGKRELNGWQCTIICARYVIRTAAKTEGLQVKTELGVNARKAGMERCQKKHDLKDLS